MSNYLTRAVESIRPGPNAIRPRLPTLFEPDATAPAQAFAVARATSPRERETAAEPDETLRARVSSVAEMIAEPQSAGPGEPVSGNTEKHGTERSSPASTLTPSIKVAPEKSAASPEFLGREESAPFAVRSSTETPAGSPAGEFQQPPKTRSPSRPPLVTLSPRIARPPAPREDATAAPAVHVTIGRIDVRAITPAAAPSPKPRPARAQLMSLDDYLRKRNGGRT